MDFCSFELEILVPINHGPLHGKVWPIGYLRAVDYIRRGRRGQSAFGPWGVVGFSPQILPMVDCNSSPYMLNWFYLLSYHIIDFWCGRSELLR